MAPASQFVGLDSPGPRELPPSTKVPMERVTPLLSSAVSKWLRAHGKTVKPKLSESQKADARMCFKLMDADGSGAIDGGELDAAFKLLGLNVTRKEVDAMLAEVDRDGSGEVEYAEFLEIMTMQLTKLSDQQQAEPAASASAAGSGSGAGNAGAAGSGAASSGSTNAASMLPFDVVATAYRRKKLMGALEEDDKDFILSVAAAEEEEKQRAEEEAAAAAAAAAARRARRPSALAALPASGRSSAAPEGGSRGSPVHSRAGGRSVSPSRGGAQSPQPDSHASFLDSLSKEERRIIETLSRKFRDERDVMEEHAQQEQKQQQKQQQQQQQQWRASPMSRQAAPAGWQGGPALGAGAHMSALHQAAAAGLPKSQLGMRPASAAATRQDDFKVEYRLGKQASAGAAAVAGSSQGLQAAGGAAGVPVCGTEGLLLPKLLFSGVKR